MISSLANAQIKELEGLKKKAKARKETRTFLIEGKKMVEEANGRIERVYVSETFYQEEQNAAFLRPDTYEVVSDKVFCRVSDTMTPQGILAVVKMPEYRLADMVKKERADLLLLENIRDPGNLGTIFRTAEGAGMDGIVLSRESVDLFNPKTVRSTMGSIFRMPFVYAEDFKETLRYLKKNGFTLYAAHLKGRNTYDGEAYERKSGILIGNEAGGLTQEAAKLADCLVKIPMEGKLESLNAAVASALLMYELYRQRRKEGSR